MEKINMLRESFNLKKFFFGSVRRKIIFNFLLVSLFVVFVSLGYIFLMEFLGIIVPEFIFKMRIYAFITGFMIILFSVVLGFFSSRKISKPIKEIFNAMNELEKENFEIRLNIKTEDELKDIGEIFNRTAKILSETKKKREEIDNAKTEFLSITSHELRSPMTPMKAQLQMVLEGYFGKINSKQREALEIVERNTTRLDRIIVDFLEISRIEAARLKFKFKKINLTKYIQHLLKEMGGFLPEKKIKILSRIDKLPVFESDSDRTMQVLRNLLNNAIKFSEIGGKILVKVKTRENDLLFSVKDEGIGMSPIDVKRIFEPFYQAEQTIFRKYSGTGLGLAISRGIVESQKGKIWVESVKGKGTTFYFTLPYKPVKEIKPIKILFSSQEYLEKQLLEVFREFLGPLGENEFNFLKERENLEEEKIFKYLDSLFKKGILIREKKEDFMKKVSIILEGEKR